MQRFDVVKMGKVQLDNARVERGDHVDKFCVKSKRLRIELPVMNSERVTLIMTFNCRDDDDEPLVLLRLLVDRAAG